MFECAAYTGTNYCHIASPSITCVRINLITKLGVLRECDQGLETRNGIKKNETTLCPKIIETHDPHIMCSFN